MGAAQPVRTVAALRSDYIGLKPRLIVQEGDMIACESPLFAHKDPPDVLVISPTSGHVRAINRGARRALVSLEIKIDETATDPLDFSEGGDANTPDGLATRLCASGLWTAFRTRPCSKVPDPVSRPAALYVTAMDTEPLAPSPAVIIREAEEAFTTGLAAVAAFSKDATYLCRGAHVVTKATKLPGVEDVCFSGPHPTGFAGTHTHFLEPPAADRTVWTIWYQDVVAIGACS